MKIIHIISALHQGGAENQLEQLIKFKSNHEVVHIVISLQDVETKLVKRLADHGIAVYLVGIEKGRILKGLYRSRCLIKANSDSQTIVQCWMYHGNFLGVFAAIGIVRRQQTFWNIRHSLHDLAYEKRSLRRIIALNKFLSFYPGTIIYNSTVSKGQHEKYGFSSKHSVYIPNGFDVIKYKPNSMNRQVVRNTFALKEGDIVIGHIARFSPMKDHAGFIKAVVSLLSTYSDLYVLMVGRNIDNNNQELLCSIPIKYRERFILLGEREDISTLMAGMDIFCLSSAWGEAFPNVLGEAMATGLPCITTDVGDSALVAGNVCSVVPARDHSALCLSLKKLIECGKIGRSDLGFLTRKRIEKSFSLKSVFENYMELYESSRNLKN